MPTEPKMAQQFTVCIRSELPVTAAELVDAIGRRIFMTNPSDRTATVGVVPLPDAPLADLHDRYAPAFDPEDVIEA